MKQEVEPVTTEDSGYITLTGAEQQIGISRVTLRKYLRQLGIEPRSFGIGGRTLYISDDERERIRKLKQNPSLLEILRTR